MFCFLDSQPALLTDSWSLEHGGSPWLWATRRVRSKQISVVGPICRTTPHFMLGLSHSDWQLITQMEHPRYLGFQGQREDITPTFLFPQDSSFLTRVRISKLRMFHCVYFCSFLAHVSPPFWYWANGCLMSFKLLTDLFAACVHWRHNN